MALFGKKKKSEPAALPVEEQDEIHVVGGDADETDDIEDGGGQVIDFDAIADELGDDDGESAMGDPLSDMNAAGADATVPGATVAAIDDFDAAASFNSGNAGLESDDELDFDSVFDDGAHNRNPPRPKHVADAATAPVAIADDNPFGAGLGEADVSNEPLAGGIAIEPVSDTPPLTYTAPLLTSDAVATAGVPATRKSFPLPLFLGALGLLLALGAVGYLVTQNNDSTPDAAPVIATSPTPRAPGSGSSGANLVSLSGVVDGVPIAPGAVGRGAPALRGPQTAVPPAIMAQLKVLWNKGAAAKKRDDFAGARAAWTEMLRIRPNHPGVQEAPSINCPQRKSRQLSGISWPKCSGAFVIPDT